MPKIIAATTPKNAITAPTIDPISAPVESALPLGLGRDVGGNGEVVVAELDAGLDESNR